MKTLEETCRSAGWTVHRFALMCNHCHLLLETRRSTLVKGMQYLARWVRQRTKVSVKWLGQQLNVRTRGGMSSAIYGVGQRLGKDATLSRRWKRLEQIG